jgi:hypothetical protein
MKRPPFHWIRVYCIDIRQKYGFLPGTKLSDWRPSIIHIFKGEDKTNEEGVEKMKTNWLKIASILYLILCLAGCNPVANPNPSNEGMPSPADMTTTAPALPAQGESTLMTPGISTPTDSGLENLIEQAKQDLAQRLAISPNQIILVEATEAEWSDSSLDCPQPGMSYLQVITPGYRILLEASETQYEYHSNRDTYVVYCENMNPPLLPKP